MRSDENLGMVLVRSLRTCPVVIEMVREERKGEVEFGLSINQVGVGLGMYIISHAVD